MPTGYLRSRRRWTSAEVAEATARLEHAGAIQPAAMPAPVVKAIVRPPHDPRPFGGFSFRLPWAPSVNKAYANKTSGGRVKTKNSALFTEAAGISILAQRVPCDYLSHPMAIRIVQHRKADYGDVDNGIKLVLDALVKFGVIADDNRKIVKRVSIEDGARITDEEYIEVSVECVL